MGWRLRVAANQITIELRKLDGARMVLVADELFIRELDKIYFMNSDCFVWKLNRLN